MIKHRAVIYPLLALLAVVGLALSWLTVTAYVGRGSAGAGYAAIYRSHRFIMPFGPHSWIAPYNEGTARVMSEDYGRAIVPLERALGTVPKVDTGGSRAESDECLVRMNLSLAYEGEALRLIEDGESDAGKILMDLAADASMPCTTDGKGGDGSNSSEDVIHQRQRDAASGADGEQGDDGGEERSGEQGGDGDSGQENAPSQPEGEESQEPSQSPSPSPSPTLDSKQEELEKNQRHAEEELRQRDQRRGEGFGSGQAW